MTLIDAHAHLGSSEELALRKQYAVPSLVCAGTPGEADRLSFLACQPSFRNILLPAFGLHPWQTERFPFDQMEPWLLKAPVIGEIGMDSVWCSIPLSIQEKAFCAQLELAADRKKPVVLHTKGQEKKTARLIARYPNIYLVHWYSGEEGLSDFLSLDCYFTIGPDVIWNPTVRHAARLIPENRLLVETDGCPAVKWAYEACPGSQDEDKKSQTDSHSDRLPLWQDIPAVLRRSILETARLRHPGQWGFTIPETFPPVNKAPSRKSASSDLLREAERLSFVMKDNFYRFVPSEVFDFTP